LAGPGPALRSPQLEETSYTGRVVNNAFRWLTLVGIVSICAWGAVRLAGDDWLKTERFTQRHRLKPFFCGSIPSSTKIVWARRWNVG